MMLVRKEVKEDLQLKTMTTEEKRKTKQGQVTQMIKSYLQLKWIRIKTMRKVTRLTI